MESIETEVVDAGRKRDERGRRIVSGAERERILAEYAASGLTQKTFARREGLRRQRPPRDVLLKKHGAAQEQAGRDATRLVNVDVASDGALVYQLDRDKLRAVCAREGRDLLRTNLAAYDPELICAVTCNCVGSRKRSARSRATSACAPFFTGGPTGSRRTCSSPFSPTAS